jgi:hypothetical protein
MKLDKLIFTVQPPDPPEPPIPPDDEIDDGKGGFK